MSLFSKKAKPRVLIVDDEPIVLEMTTEFLKNGGFEAATALSTAQALERLGEKRVDAVLLDVHIPGESGLEAISKIRAAQPGVPIILFTGAGYQNDLMQEALKAGANGFVSKGTEMENLGVAIRRALSPAMEGKKTS
ncbi:MAG: response regulator [Verrucomicrobiae bacterium]|nr:response regulator [Verrucomicrobiae bacterium]